MSDETQVPQDLTPKEKTLIEQNVKLMESLGNLQGQVSYLTNRLKEVTPPMKAPVFPTTDMPADPVMEGQPKLPEGMVRADCQGVVEVLPDASTSPVTPPAEGKMRIMIGVPLLAVSYEFFESFLKFWTELCMRKDPRYEITYHFAYRKPVHMAEEYLVKTALFNKCTHILLMDDDIFDITASDLNKLIEAKLPFISGVMHASKFPHAMCVFRRYDVTKKVIDMPADNSMYRLYEIPAICPHCQYPQSHWDAHFCINCGEEIDITIQEVDLTPFPFTLIDLKVFDKIKKPWFHCTSEYPTDSWFCDRLMEAGIKPAAHMLVRLNHAGITDETKPHFSSMGLAKMNKNKAVVNIAPDQMEVHQTLLYNKMQEAERAVKARPPILTEAGIVNEPKKELTLLTSCYK